MPFLEATLKNLLECAGRWGFFEGRGLGPVAEIPCFERLAFHGGRLHILTLMDKPSERKSGGACAWPSSNWNVFGHC